MPNSKVPIRNPDGYIDTTAHDAICNVLKEQNCLADEPDARNNKLVKALKQLIDLAGFDLVERIALRDRKTGRIYR